MPGSIQLTFSSVGGDHKNMGPVGSLRFEAETLREAAGGPVIATHAGHAWVLEGGARYTRLDCQSAVSLHFERANGGVSKTYGPYASFSCVDGVAYADREVFAFVDRSINDWYCHPDGRHWAVMMVTPAA